MRGGAAHAQAALRQGARRVLDRPAAGSPPYLAHISPISPPYLAHTSPIPRPYLAHISPIPPPHLAHISQDAYEYLSHVLDQLQRIERSSGARMCEGVAAGGAPAGSDMPLSSLFSFQQEE